MAKRKLKEKWLAFRRLRQKNNRKKEGKGRDYSKKNKCGKEKGYGKREEKGFLQKAKILPWLSLFIPEALGHKM